MLAFYYPMSHAVDVIQVKKTLNWKSVYVTAVKSVLSKHTMENANTAYLKQLLADNRPIYAENTSL